MSKNVFRITVMVPLLFAFLLMGALIIPVGVSAQKALPQNIFCIMTVDDTIDCHETEEACEIIENQMINEISNCSSFTNNLAGQVQQDFDGDDDNDDNNQQSETNEQSNLDGCPNTGCVNIGGSQEVGESVRSEPMGQHEGDVTQAEENEQSQINEPVRDSDTDNEESED